MDLWVVAAVAGVGYLAKFLKNVSRDKGNVSELSSVDSHFQNPKSPRCPLRKLARKKNLSKDVCSDRGVVSDGSFTDISPIDNASTVDIADCEELNIMANNVDCNLQEGTHRSTKIRSSLRCNHVLQHFGKPQNSMESCLIAQLYKAKDEMEEYVSLLSSPPIPQKPLLITNGSQVTNRASDSYFKSRVNSEKKLHEEACSESSDTVFGVPLLPDISSLELSKDMKPTTREERSRKLNISSKTGNRKHLQILDGSTERMLHFCLGVCIGIVSLVVTNRREVDNLKELLKQTENLVQDLQEELEMKELLTVKELANEKLESFDKCDCSVHGNAPNAHAHEQNTDISIKFDGKESYDHNEEESSESMSKIEAELEAELERLGLNTDTSSVHISLPDHVEIDPEFVAEFAEGELRTDMLSGQGVDQSDLDQDASSTCTSHSANYAVSPRELSLRLYEVIQERLEERVEELETALQKSQRKMKLMESEPNKLKYSSTRESPIAQPLVMDLSREALDAYNEAYEESMKMSQSEEEESPSVAGGDAANRFDDFMFGGLNSLTLRDDNETRIAAEEEATISTRIEELNDICGSISITGDEGSDCDYDDESEKLLIKQIVEKTRKGSPVVLNAQMLLFSMDERE